MAKRFTDTSKWSLSFRGLALKHKLLWIFLFDFCDPSGIWEIDFVKASFEIGDDISREEGLKVLNDHVIKIDEKRLFFKKFIEVNYDGTLSDNCIPHKKVIKQLNDYRLLDQFFDEEVKEDRKGSEYCVYTLKKNTNYPSPRVETTLKEEEEEEEIEIDKEEEIEEDHKQHLDFGRIYEEYPRKLGRKKGIEYCVRRIKSAERYDQLLKAVQNYSAHVQSRGTNLEYIKHFSTFMNCWEDWINPEPAALGGRGIEEDLPIGELRKIYGEDN